MLIFLNLVRIFTSLSSSWNWQSKWERRFQELELRGYFELFDNDLCFYTPLNQEDSQELMFLVLPQKAKPSLWKVQSEVIMKL